MTTEQRPSNQRTGMMIRPEPDLEMRLRIDAARARSPIGKYICAIIAQHYAQQDAQPPSSLPTSASAT